MPAVTVGKQIALDQQRENFTVMSHELPATFEDEGLLGLDFFRGLVLTLDFANGTIDLARPKPVTRRWWPFAL